MDARYIFSRTIWRYVQRNPNHLAFIHKWVFPEVLTNDREDLIQNAVGWLLREIGKSDIRTEEGF